LKLLNKLSIAAGAIALVFALPAAAQEATKIKFTLDWKIQGSHAWFYWAKDMGYFKAENLDVTIDQGNGSAAAVAKVMSGTYQAGFGDMNAIIQGASTKPGEAPVMVYMIYNRAPFALITKADSSIKTPKDAEGRTLGTPAGSAAGKLFSALAKKNGIDEKKITWTNMAPNLQEQMLMRGQVEASTVFSITSYMNLTAMGVDPEKDIRWMFYNDQGLDLYSNGVLVSNKLAKENPKAVTGLVKAINRAMQDCIAKPDPCIDNLAKTEPLINKDIEKRRMIYLLKNNVLTEEAAELGLGDINDARMARAVTEIVESYELTRSPTPGEIFSREFLPPKSDRLVKTAL
jgi:NitT/TauT family transport system substrate-binding protein